MCNHPSPNAQQQKWLRQAISLSETHLDHGLGGPFGAIIVKQGQLIAEGFNQVTGTNDPTAHAEIVAIRQACQLLNTFDLSGCELYTSCEPCPMCLSAIYWARLEKVYYANTRQDAAQIGFDDAFIYQQVCLPIEQRSLEMQHIKEPNAAQAFKTWQALDDKTAY